MASNEANKTEDKGEVGLPDGWEERYDTIHGRPFYVQPERRIAQLEDPRISGSQTSQYGKDWIYVIDKNAPLRDFPWFYGSLSYQKVVRLLKEQPEGTFLIRKSKSSPGRFVIAVKNAAATQGVLQIQIAYKNEEYYLYVNDFVSFSSLPKLVEHYTRHPAFPFGKLTAPLDKFKIEKVKDRESVLPEELEYDPYTQELYEKAIEEGIEKDSTIRVMVIGCYGQGKTSLVRRLLKQSIEGVETTNGIDLHRCAIINNVEWVKQESEDPEDETIKRLVNIAKFETDYVDTPFNMHHENYETTDEGSTELYNRIDTADACSSISNKVTYVNIAGLTIIDKSDAKIIQKEVRHNKSERQIEKKSSVKRSKIDSQTLKKFQTELTRIGSDENERKNKRATLNIWDFGGQFVYYATHQIFHSRQAVYILVFNLNEELDKIIKDDDFPLHKKTMRDYLKFWISSVDTFVGSVDGYIPPIILVGTHTDQLQEGVDVYGYFEEVRKIFDGSSCLNHIQPDHFALSNKDLSEKDIDKLRKSIIHLGNNQLQTSIPAKWILLEKALKMKKTKKIVRLDEILEIDSKTESPLQTQDQQETIDQIKLFLSYHHARGTFCYFDDSKLSEYAVLDPQFLIDAFRCIITAEQFCQVRPKMRSLWRELCQKAILRPELLKEVWTHNDDKNFIHFEPLLTLYLQKHRIVSEVVALDPNTEFSLKQLGYYIVPSFLKVSDDGSVIESLCKGKKLPGVSLGYVLENEAMAPVLFHTTLSALIGRWPIVSVSGKDILYDNVVACELVRDHAGVLKLTNNSIELLVVNLCPPDGVRADVCDMFRRYIEMVINTGMCKLHSTNDDRHCLKHMTVRCLHTDHGPTGSNSAYVFEEMQSCVEEKMPCPDKGNHCLRFKHILHEWFLHQTELEMIPQRKMTSKEYSTLSMAIGQGWQQIGLQLGLDDIALQHIEVNEQTLSMRIYTMFKLWDKKKADEATLDVLVRAIYKCSGLHDNVNLDKLKNIINGF